MVKSTIHRGKNVQNVSKNTILKPRSNDKYHKCVQKYMKRFDNLSCWAHLVTIILSKLDRLPTQIELKELKKQPVLSNLVVEAIS